MMMMAKSESEMRCETKQRQMERALYRLYQTGSRNGLTDYALIGAIAKGAKAAILDINPNLSVTVTISKRQDGDRYDKTLPPAPLS